MMATVIQTGKSSCSNFTQWSYLLVQKGFLVILSEHHTTSFWHVHYFMFPGWPHCSKSVSIVFFAFPALQSPIEYQRRESKTHSLGRTGALHHSLTGGSTRPSSSTSMDQNKGSSLQAHNASLPSLYLPGPAPPDPLPSVEVRQEGHQSGSHLR